LLLELRFNLVGELLPPQQRHHHAPISMLVGALISGMRLNTFDVHTPNLQLFSGSYAGKVTIAATAARYRERCCVSD
jgi:hypothetical protein